MTAYRVCWFRSSFVIIVLLTINTNKTNAEYCYPAWLVAPTDSQSVRKAVLTSHRSAQFKNLRLCQ